MKKNQRAEAGIQRCGPGSKSVVATGEGVACDEEHFSN
jgi:hypothetical protein